MSGPIPAALGDLANLRSIRLAQNAFTGCVPHALRYLVAQGLVPGFPAHEAPFPPLSLCLLRDLRLAGAILEPSFRDGTDTYTIAVGRSVAATAVTATLHDAGDRLTIHKGGEIYANGAAVPLDPGPNVITIEMIPGDGTPPHIVTVTVTRSRTDPIALSLRAGGDLVVMPAGVATTAADLFGESDVASVWLYSWRTRAWDYSYFPRLDRGNFAIAGGDVLWVVAPVAQTLVVQGTPPASDPGPITLTLRQGGDLVPVPEGTPTTADALFRGTDVTIVWKYNRETRLWDLSYLPALGSRNFPVEHGDVLWVVTPRALTVTAGAPAGDAVSGRVYFGGGEVTLPEGAVVTVRLLDTSYADAPAMVIGEQIIRDARGLPLTFRVGYDPAAIRERNEYALQATVRHEGCLLYINDTVHPVLTRGAPLDRDVEVIRVE